MSRNTIILLYDIFFSCGKSIIKPIFYLLFFSSSFTIIILILSNIIGLEALFIIFLNLITIFPMLFNIPEFFQLNTKGIIEIIKEQMIDINTWKVAFINTLLILGKILNMTFIYQAIRAILNRIK